MKIARYTKPISVVISEEVFEIIKILSNQNQVSVSEIVRAILDEFLKIQPKKSLLTIKDEEMVQEGSQSGSREELFKG